MAALRRGHVHPTAPAATVSLLQLHHLRREREVDLHRLAQPHLYAVPPVLLEPYRSGRNVVGTYPKQRRDVDAAGIGGEGPLRIGGQVAQRHVGISQRVAG